MLEQTSDYVNVSAMKARLALETQEKTQAANDYTQAHSAAGMKEQTREQEVAAEEEKLLKPSDAQSCKC